jgi:hypothetical protein
VIEEIAEVEQEPDNNLDLEGDAPEEQEEDAGNAEDDADIEPVEPEQNYLEADENDQNFGEGEEQ